LHVAISWAVQRDADDTIVDVVQDGLVTLRLSRRSAPTCAAILLAAQRPPTGRPRVTVPQGSSAQVCPISLRAE
jgi:hypothetical protein